MFYFDLDGGSKPFLEVPEHCKFFQSLSWVIFEQDGLQVLEVSGPV